MLSSGGQHAARRGVLPGTGNDAHLLRWCTRARRKRAGRWRHGGRDRVGTPRCRAPSGRLHRSDREDAKDARARKPFSVGEAAGSAAASLRDTTSSTYGQARSVQARRGPWRGRLYGLWGRCAIRRPDSDGNEVSRPAPLTTSRDMFDFCCDQPLVLAGLGIALGGAVAQRSHRQKRKTS